MIVAASVHLARLCSCAFLQAADTMGVAAPKRLKRKQKKGVRIRKHMVIRVSVGACVCGWREAPALRVLRRLPQMPCGCSEGLLRGDAPRDC